MERFQSTTPMKAAKIGYIVMSAICCVLGVLFIVFPQISVSVIGMTMGITLILFGVIKLIGYFSKDLYRLAFQYDLAFGILLLALGIAMLCRLDNVINFICIVLGIVFLADGLFKIQMAMDSKTFGIRLWWLIFLFAVLTGIFGILLIFRPAAGSQFLMILIGISLLCEGVLSLSTVLTVVKIIKNQEPDHIEAEFTEKKG